MSCCHGPGNHRAHFSGAETHCEHLQTRAVIPVRVPLPAHPHSLQGFAHPASKTPSVGSESVSLLANYCRD